MIKYEILPTVCLIKENVQLRSQMLPELVHMDDPALAVMTDFSQSPPTTIHWNENMDDALNEMKVKGLHLLLVIDTHGHIQGLVGSEDILGEKPIKIIQERRIQRSQVLVKMIMLPLEQVAAFNFEIIEHARVGNVVNTLQVLQTHYALVIDEDGTEGMQIIRGLFNTSQISKQLHRNIALSITQAQTISELQKRHGD